MMRPVVALLITLVTLGGCGDAAVDDPTPAPSLLEGERARLARLATVEGYETVEDLPVTDLFGFLTGRWRGSHNFPAIYLDPGARTVSVTAGRSAKSWPAAELDEALTSYRAILVARGYPVDGEAREIRPHVLIDGEEWVLVDLRTVLPDPSEARSQFTARQWSFLYGELDGWLGFSYLAGLGPTGRDYPLIVALDAGKTARLRVLGRDLAREFSFDEVSDAFSCYRKYVDGRLAD